MAWAASEIPIDHFWAVRPGHAFACRFPGPRPTGCYLARRCCSGRRRWSTAAVAA